MTVHNNYCEDHISLSFLTLTVSLNCCSHHEWLNNHYYKNISIHFSLSEDMQTSILMLVKRWHHTNSIAIVGYISNTPPNPRSARNWPTGVKGARRWRFKLVTFWTYSLTMDLNHQQRWPRRRFTQVITH